MQTRPSQPDSPKGRTRTLVTGGAGFIGSHLCEALLARGDVVTVVDNLSTGRRENLPASHANLRFLEADLSDALEAFGPGEVFDEIYHLAAAVGVDLIVRDRIESIQTNVEQTASLLRFAAAQADKGTEPRTLITSSSEVYGKADTSPFSETDDVVYGPTSVTRWSYACSKAIDEYLAMAYSDERGLPVSIVRLFNTVGPRQVGHYGMVLPRFVEAALSDQPLRVFGTGQQTRCFCHVLDIVDALPKVIALPDCRGTVLNIGSAEPVSIEELAAKVIAQANSASTIEHIPYDKAYAPGFEDPQRRQPDLSRARNAIGFEARRSLDTIIADVIAWMESSG